MHLPEPMGYGYSPYALPTMLAGVGLLVLGVVLLVRERHNRLGRLYLGMALPVCASLFAKTGLLLAVDEGVASYWARAVLLASVLIPPAVLHCHAALNAISQKRNKLITLSWALSAVFSLDILVGGVFYAGLHRYSWGFYPRLGWLSAVYLLLVGGIAIQVARDYVELRQHARTQSEGRRSKSLLLAFAIGMLACLDFLPMVGVRSYPVGFLPVLFFLALVAWMVVKQRLVDFSPEFAATEILNTVPDAVLVCDRDGRIKLTNAKVTSFFGYLEDNLINQPLEILADPAGEAVQVLQQLPDKLRGTKTELDLTARDGRKIAVALSSAPLVSRGRTIVGLVVVAQDRRQQKRANDILERAHEQLEKRIEARTTELIQANQQLQKEIAEREKVERALRESEERYALAVRGANDGLWDWDLAKDKIYFSPRWKSMLSLPTHMIGNNPEEWFCRVHPEDLDQLKLDLRAHIEGITTHFESEHRLRHQDGSYRWMLTRGLAVRGVGGEAYRMAGSQSDITDRKQAEEQLVSEALEDALTGLPNRALLMDRLERAICRIQRYHERHFAVLFMDLDRFKLVNDSLGHLVGDELLVNLARRLKSCMRSMDTVARLGGDEFVVLLEEFESNEQVIQVANRIQQELQKPFQLKGHEIFISASIGIVFSDTGCTRPEDFLRDADIAMYHAKALGRARFAIFDTGMRERAAAALQIENELRRALNKGEIEVSYQPIISLADGRLGALEALVRWRHPQRGLLKPHEFLGVAEDSGLIVPLTRAVLRQACAQLRTWHTQFPALGDLKVSVNMPSRQFNHRNFIPMIKQILKESGLPGDALILEITESAILEDIEGANRLLDQLQGIGIRVQMDDFGTGYSSLNHLHRFPITAIKIDRSFISAEALAPQKAQVVQAILSMARSLGIEAIAEGIETREQLSKLKEFGCSSGQGYYFSEPLIAAETTSYLAAYLEDPACPACLKAEAAALRPTRALTRPETKPAPTLPG